jgi:deoxyadenosine/deoxycytidine kinase
MEQIEQTIPIIYIEGGIGSGKSTLVQKLQQYSNKRLIKYITVQEPVDIWMNIVNENGTNMIEAFYQNQDKYSFHFQMMAYISRLEKLQHVYKQAINNNIDFIICERSLYTDKNVFCKMLYDDGKIDTYGYQIYNKWFDYFQNFIKKFKFVYLQTDFEVCFQRIQKRHRKGEDNISKDYIFKNNLYHDKWLLNMDNVLILNGNLNGSDDVFQQHCETILNFILHH